MTVLIMLYVVKTWSNGCNVPVWDSVMAKRFFFLVLAALVALRLVCELGRPLPPEIPHVENALDI